MLDNAKVTLYEGLGRMLDPHTVEIVNSEGGVERHTTKYILIATGGRATLLDIPGKVKRRNLAIESFSFKFFFEGFFGYACLGSKNALNRYPGKWVVKYVEGNVGKVKECASENSQF